MIHLHVSDGGMDVRGTPGKVCRRFLVSASRDVELATVRGAVGIPRLHEPIRPSLRSCLVDAVRIAQLGHRRWSVVVEAPLPSPRRIGTAATEALRRFLGDDGEGNVPEARFTAEGGFFLA